MNMKKLFPVVLLPMRSACMPQEPEYVDKNRIEDIINK
jgi:hypothetical protein